MMIVRYRIKDLAGWIRRRGYLYEDCSSLATGCYFIAGLLDPNNLHYNGQGYTGTLAVHGKWVSVPEPGDLVLYGWGFPYHHVAIYVGGGRVVSHGSESGPLLLYTRYRSDLAMFRRY
jgi:cell wall-associated NlpC family hydrolase